MCLILVLVAVGAATTLCAAQTTAQRLAMPICPGAATTLCAAQTTAQRLAMPICPAATISLSPCIGYAFGVGSATLSSCCSQLQTFFQSQGPCLCAASKLASAGPIGMFVGQAQAMIPNTRPRKLKFRPDHNAAAGDSSRTGTTAATMAPTPASAPDTPAVALSTTQADPEGSQAPEVPTEESPATVTSPGQVVPGDDGSSSGPQT
ncbi:hypothetical protein GUJ93_ZPchr0013g34181 [Zizania palustris]|uniref:Bifunctional inhibitor/plant lipid transfer protein/seed storage helical domain-containing protein n=1 Tax=Zizania palustris TaxID=103762 RepID=A0A8J5WYB4_ZIZPA|nr:hypothetical protein GUJ93_ZPchr0013g34181 [Zizania palustris]